MRLKWGDPFVFDSGGKEALFLHEQGIPFEVVPGIPAAIGAPAYAGIPITYPDAGDVADAVRGHEAESDTPPEVDWAAPRGARRHARLPRGRADRSARSRARCSTHGRRPEEAAALIYDGTTPRSRPSSARSATIAERARDKRGRRC